MKKGKGWYLQNNKCLLKRRKMKTIGKAATIFLPIIVTNRSDNWNCTLTKPIPEGKNRRKNNGMGSIDKCVENGFKIVTLLPSWQAGCEHSVSTKVTSDFNRPCVSYRGGSDSKGHFNSKNLQSITRAFRSSTTNSESLSSWHSNMDRCSRKWLNSFKITVDLLRLHCSKTTWSHEKY